MALRLTSSDKHASNLKAERELCHARGDTFSSLGFTCDVHTVAGCHTKCGVLMKDDISGLLNMALSLAASSYMRKFRQCLIDVVEERLVFLHGRPPHSAVEYRQHAMDLFLARGPDWRARRSMLALVLPGDWRNEDQVEYYFHMPGVDDRVPEAELRQVIAAGVVRLKTSGCRVTM